MCVVGPMGNIPAGIYTYEGKKDKKISTKCVHNPLITLCVCVHGRVIALSADKIKFVCRHKMSCLIISKIRNVAQLSSDDRIV